MRINTVVAAGMGMYTMGSLRAVVTVVAVAAVVTDRGMVWVARTAVVQRPLFSTRTRANTTIAAAMVV